MELKVWVEGIQRIVCGVTETTTCQVLHLLFIFYLTLLRISLLLFAYIGCGICFGPCNRKNWTVHIDREMA